MFGTDAMLTQTYGCPQCTWDFDLLSFDKNAYYNIAFPQAHLELFAPFGNGLTAKIGHFYTPVGYEVVTAPDNFFYSHAYTMQYGEPFRHTGILLSYPVTPNWARTGGVVTGSEFGGWDGAFNSRLGAWSGIGGVTWTSDDKGTSFGVTGTTGPFSKQNRDPWSIYSLVLKHDLIEGLHFVMQHDQGFASNVMADGGDATWYGINSYLMYDVQDDVGVGVRFEYFRDQDGYRVVSPGRVGLLSLNKNYADTHTLSPGIFPGPNTYYALTLGANWKPLRRVNVRPNLRWDWAQDADAFGNKCGNAGFEPTKKDQLLFSTDVVVLF